MLVITFENSDIFCYNYYGKVIVMEWYHIVLIVLGSLIVLISILFPFILSYILYAIHMVRTSKDKWNRNSSSLDNKEQLDMWNDGLDYIKNYQDKIKEVHIVNDKLNLYGEYVDIGADRAVIILGGRCECLYYAYHYAKPYLENNCNVLVIDQRAHGKSDGKINTVGFKESKDLLAWAKLLHDTYNNKQIIIHGTCIGGATGIHALASKDCPSYINKIIVDGIFRTYYESFKLHMIDQGRPLWPCLDLTFVIYKLIAKIDAKKQGPITLMDKITQDILFVSSLTDKYVSKESILELYDKCASKNKEYVFLDKGNHSHLRINQEETYDKIITDFINK